METIEVRPAINRREVEQAYDIWGTVFPEDRTFFQERLDLDRDYSLDTTYLAFVDGRLAAATQLFPFRISFGSVTLKVGGIGNVATLPEYRGRGLAHQILRRQCSYMRTRGYDLSLLMTGINPFYEKVGWQTIIDQEWAADSTVLKNSAAAGTSRIRLFDESDLDQVSRLYDAAILDAVALRKRSKAYWRGQLQWKAVPAEHFLVAEQDGKIAAYLRYKVTSDHQLHVMDCTYAAGQDEAAVDLLRHAVAEKDVSVVKAMLPAGHALQVVLQRHGAETEEVSYKMWRTFDLYTTLSKMAPELERRVRQSDLDGELQASILFSVEGEEAVVTVKNGTVEIAPAAESVIYQSVVTLTSQEWLTLLLKGSDTLGRAEGAETNILKLLFPARPYIFWPVDHF